MLNRPAESYFTRKFSNRFVVMDSGLWRIHSVSALLNTLKAASVFLASLSYRFYASLQLVVSKAKLILTAYFACWLYVKRATWTLFSNF